jgi:site-specific recombinase XerD
MVKKTEAKAFCMRLFKDGLLIPGKKVPTFAEYSCGWWDIETCRYLKWRQLHSPMAQNTIDLHKINFVKHIKGYFEKYRLDEITPPVIEGWLVSLSEKKMKTKAGKEWSLKPKTINLVYGTFKLMMHEAVRLKLLKVNPCLEVKELKQEELKRVILTMDEIRKLFPPDWTTIWSNRVVYLAHRLAACTVWVLGEYQNKAKPVYTH